MDISTERRGRVDDLDRIELAPASLERLREGLWAPEEDLELVDQGRQLA